MAKKLLSCLIALTLILGMVALNVSADTKLTIKASDATVNIGEDVEVEISVTSSDVSYFAFNVEWDKTLLTYKNYEKRVATSDNDTVVRVFDGYIEYQTMRDANAEVEFDGTVFLVLTFTAASDITGREVNTPINVVVWSDDDEGYCDKEFNPMAAADVADVDGTVTIKKPHLTPVVTADIVGDGMVGKALTAGVDTADNWDLVPDYTYSWTIDGEEVSDKATYTPIAADLNKDITLTVTATVEADENATATQTDTIKVIKNDSYKPVVELGEVAKTVKAGSKLDITYNYSDGNGIADASYVNIYTADTKDGEYTFYNKILATDSKIVIPVAKALAGKFMRLDVVPANVDGDEGTAAVPESIEVMAPAVEPENVTLLSTNPYDMEGYTLIKVVATDVDAADEKIVIGSAVLYYSSQKSAFYGAVTAEDVGAAVTQDNIALAAEIVDSASSVFYFGKAKTPTSSAKVSAQDVGAAKRIALGTYLNPGVDACLASDVNSAEPDGKITAYDIAALKKNILSGVALKVLE